MRRTIAARELIRADESISFPLLTVEDGIIVALAGADRQPEQGSATHVFPDAVIAPAYVDVHVHGGRGHDVMEATPEALDTVSDFLAHNGVGAFLPTTVTSSEAETLRALAGLARYINRTGGEPTAGAAALGVHLEGPFLSHRKRGVHTEALLRPPSIQTFERMWQAAEGNILLLTVAPELPGALDLIRYATALGVRCSVGHTNATYAEAEAAYAAGAVSATHTFNAMRALDHRDPGVVAFVLDQSELFAEIIADGYHVDPALVRLFYKMKGEDRTLLITDGISAAGMPDGHYKLGEMDVQVVDGKCTSAGAIAGSTLRMDRAVRNLMEFTGTSLHQAVKAGSGNAAKLIGKSEGWGVLETGRTATFNVLSRNGELIETFLRGEPIRR